MAISIVNTGQGTFNSTTIAATSITSGNMIVVAWRNNSDMGGVTITDTVGNTYIPINSIGNIGVWIAISSGSNGSNVVTISGGTGFQSGCSVQLSGAESDFLAIRSSFLWSATGTLTFPTPTVANGILIIAAQTSTTGGTWTAGTGYTKQVEDTQNVLAIETQIVTTSSAYASSFTTSSAVAPRAVLLFIPDDGTGAPGPAGGVIGARIQTGY